MCTIDMEPDWQCELLCVKMTHQPIELPHQTPIVVGRSEVTQITDKKVSRKQVEIAANCFERKVRVKQLGSNPSAVGCEDLKKGKIAIIKEGTILHILSGKYPHKIRFFHSKHAYGYKNDEQSPKLGSSPKKNDGGKGKKTFINEYFGGESSKSIKRKLDDENCNKSKKAKLKNTTNDLSEEEEEEEKVRKLQEKLDWMRQTSKQIELANNSRMSHLSGKKESQSSVIKPQRGLPTSTAKWDSQGSLLMFTSCGVEARHKIAAFDIDSTIICTKSGKKFPTYPEDWKIMLNEVPARLKQLFENGYKIVFFTNQAGIKKGKVKVPDYKKKIEGIIKELGVPVQIFASTGPGPYRKPGLGMWQYLLENANEGIPVDVQESFYVGDAAGRPDKWAVGKKKDFSCSDRLFALNAKLKFYTPEEYFLGLRKAPFKLPDFNPGNLDPDGPISSPPDAILAATNQEIIVTVGFPASGKSFFSKKYLMSEGYAHINRDTLGTWQKCVEATKRYLQQGKSVVVDNTNLDKAARKRYVDVAKEAGVVCRCFQFTATFDHCRHNERFREMTDKEHQPVNEMIMNSFKYKLQEPEISEGFTEVVKINFVPKFSDDKLKQLYQTYLLS